MEKRDLRLLMNYDFHSNLSATESYNRIKTAYPHVPLCYDTVREWYSRFRAGSDELGDCGRSGRPRTAVTEENIIKARDLIEENPSITYDSLQMELGVGRLSVETILTEHLRVKKLVAKFVPHVLTNAQKQARVEFCEFMLQKFKRGSSPTDWDIVTGDET